MKKRDEEKPVESPLEEFKDGDVLTAEVVNKLIKDVARLRKDVDQFMTDQSQESSTIPI